jgi:hypothetical protein
MSLGAWIFAAVVLVLVVVNPSFRKFFLRAVVVLAAIAVVVGIGWYFYNAHERRVAEAAQKAYETQEKAEREKRVDDCVARQKAGGVPDGAAQTVCAANPDAEVETDPWKVVSIAPTPAPKPKPVPARHVRAKYSTDLVTAEYGSLKCGEVEAGEVLTLLSEGGTGETEIKVKTKNGKVGWAAAYMFEVVQ